MKVWNSIKVETDNVLGDCAMRLISAKILCDTSRPIRKSCILKEKQWALQLHAIKLTTSL